MNMRNLPITQLASNEEKVKAFLHLLKNAEDHAKETIQLTERNRKFYEGQHYLKQNLDGSWTRSPVMEKFKWRPRISTDDIYEAVSSLIPIIIRSKPHTNIKAEEPDAMVDFRELGTDGEELVGEISNIKSSSAAEIMGEVREELGRKRSETIMNSQIVLESLIAGSSYVTWDILPTRQGSRIMPKLLMREQFLGDPDGNKTWDFSDYRYVIIRHEMTAAEIKYYYDADYEDYAGGSGMDLLDKKSVGIVGRWFSKKSEAFDDYGMRKFPVDTLFWNDILPVVGFGEMDEIRDKGVPEMQQMIFVNEKLLVRDRENPYWHKGYPVTAFTSAPRPFRQDGTSDVSMLVGTQIAINLAHNLMLGNAQLAGSHRIWAEEGAIPKGKFDNTPGAVNWFNKGALTNGQVQNIPPGAVGTELMNLYQLEQQKIREKIGDSQGLLQPNNIRSGRHAQTVLNAVLTRHGYRVTMLDPAWERLARQEISYLQQYFDFSGYYLGQEYSMEDEEMVYDMPMALKNLRYDVEIESKEDLPHSVEDRINLLMVLLQTGLADGEEFYRQTGFSVRPELRESIRVQSEAQEFRLGLPFNEAALMQLQSENATDQILAEGQVAGGQAPVEATQQAPAPSDADILGALQQGQ